MTIKSGFIQKSCQAYSDYQIEDGDSGAPVLLDIVGGTDTTVTLGGINWGTVLSGPDSGMAVFSPWSQILKSYPGLPVN